MIRSDLSRYPGLDRADGPCPASRLTGHTFCHFPCQGARRSTAPGHRQPIGGCRHSLEQ